MSEPLGLALAIIMCVGGVVGTVSGLLKVSFLGVIVGAPLWVLTPLFIYRVCTVLNELPDSMKVAAQIPSPSYTGPRGFGIAGLILGILSIIIPYLGALFGIVGIVLSVKQRKTHKEGFSTAGLITSIVGTSLWGLVTLILIVFLALR